MLNIKVIVSVNIEDGCQTFQRKAPDRRKIHLGKKSNVADEILILSSEGVNNEKSAKAQGQVILGYDGNPERLWNNDAIQRGPSEYGH